MCIKGSASEFCQWDGWQVGLLSCYNSCRLKGHTVKNTLAHIVVNWNERAWAQFEWCRRKVRLRFWVVKMHFTVYPWVSLNPCVYHRFFLHYIFFSLFMSLCVFCETSLRWQWVFTTIAKLSTNWSHTDFKTHIYILFILDSISLYMLTFSWVFPSSFTIFFSPFYFSFRSFFRRSLNISLCLSSRLSIFIYSTFIRIPNIITKHLFKTHTLLQGSSTTFSVITDLITFTL